MKTWFSPSVGRLAAAAAFALILRFASIPASVAAEAPDCVDHRYYALEGWIGAIGLPDDCFKCVVDADGRFLTELGKSKGHQGVYPSPPAQNPLSIQAEVLGGATRVSQKMDSPRVPIAITQKRHKEVTITEHLFTAGPLDWTANVKGDALRRRGGPDTRQYLLMVEYVNQGAKPVDITPVIQLQGYPWARLNESRRLFSVTHNTQCSVSREMESFQPKTSAATPTTQATVVLKKLLLQPGGREKWFLVITRNIKSQAMLPPTGWATAEAVRTGAIEFWENRAALPYDVIQLPDPEIQAILDASIRELYQMRYVIRGLPAYFFGPGCYNDYWILDGSFVTEAMDMLGRVEDAGGYADYLLLHQQKDGRIQCMNEHWKETGIALVTLFRHARMTQDKEWLLKRWPQFVCGVEAIQNLRRTGSSADPKALNYRLSPVGFGDGGVGREAEYTNNHWLLAGMHAAVEAAEWLGKAAEAKSWKEQFADYQDAFRKAIQRDAKTDTQGNRYIPAVMGPKTPQYPTRGQWAFCQGVYPGRIFAPDDPMMLGTMKMLQANEVQGGIIENSGWIGIWAQCGSFYGHDWLWLGNGRKAAELLYAFANHASPLNNFREEMPKQTKPGEKFPYARGGGDMPHVSASAEFIRLTGHLLAFDRGDELHLLEGLPSSWLKPGSLLRLNGLRTPFGPLRLTLTVSQNGTVASLHIAPLSDSSCRKIVLHFGAWSADGSRPTTDLAPDKAHDLAFRVSR